MDYDLLAIDLDGTLLDSEHQLPTRNRAALHRAHAAGVRIVLCTGRSFTEMRGVIEQIGLDLDAAVSVFGALVTEVATGRTLDRTPIPLDVALRASAWLLGLGYPVLWLTDPTEAGFDGYVFDGPRRHPAVDRWIERTACRVRAAAAVPPDVVAPIRLSIIDDTEPLEAVSARLTAEFDGQLTHNILVAPPYSLSLIEAFAPQVNKWYAIEKLCRWWSIEPGRTVAVGDDVNDLEMIRRAGLGVAMGNARPAVRDAAKRVVGSNDGCGVAELIEGLLDGCRVK